MQSSTYNPSAHEFISQAEFEELSRDISKAYGVSPTQDVKHIKTTIKTKENYIVAKFLVPLSTNSHQYDVYQIIPINMFNNNTRYKPILEYDYMAFSISGVKSYIPMTEPEATLCVQTSFCTPASPSYDTDEDMCSACSFYSRSQCCEFYTEISDKPDFYTISNKTYYSVKPDHRATFSITCLSGE